MESAFNKDRLILGVEKRYMNTINKQTYREKLLEELK